MDAIDARDLGQGGFGFLENAIRERDRQLAALRERVEALEASKKAAETLLKEADLLFNQTAELCDDANSEEWLWKWKVRYYFEDTEIPPHALPADMRGDE